MQNEKVLVIGCTGQVALPVAKSLATNNEVTGVARFNNRKARRALEESGVICHPLDLAAPDLSGLPRDFTYVLNFSVSRTGSWPADLDINVGAICLIMEHCQSALAMFHCSTAGVYQPEAGHVFTEDDPLGDNHRAWEQALPFLSTYSISKIASEAAVRYGSRRFEFPAVVARLSVPYGDNGGWPAFHLELMAAGEPIDVHPERPIRCNPIHEDDIMATIPLLLDAAATVPPTVVNWGGPESSVEEWCAELGTLTGIQPRFRETMHTISSLPVDTSKLTSLAGPVDRMSLKDGLERMVRTRRPDLLDPLS
jgi:UDP-glucuronate 4-epimerase